MFLPEELAEDIGLQTLLEINEIDEVTVIQMLLDAEMLNLELHVMENFNVR